MGPHRTETPGVGGIGARWLRGAFQPWDLGSFPDVSPSPSLLPPGPPGTAPRGTTGSRGTGTRSAGTRCSGTCRWGHVCPQGCGTLATSSPGTGPPWDSRGPAVTRGWHQKPPRSLGAAGTRTWGHPGGRGRGPGVPLPPPVGPDPPSCCPCAHLGVPQPGGVPAVPREGTGLRRPGDGAKCHLCHQLSPPAPPCEQGEPGPGRVRGGPQGPPRDPHVWWP